MGIELLTSALVKACPSLRRAGTTTSKSILEHCSQDFIALSTKITWPDINHALVTKLRSADEIHALTTTIEEGVQLIKTGQFTEAIHHFWDSSKIRAAGMLPMEDYMSPASLNQLAKLNPSEGLEGIMRVRASGKAPMDYNFEISSDVFKSKGSIMLTPVNLDDTANHAVNQETRHMLALMGLEEWLHSAQDAFGRPLTRVCQNIQDRLGYTTRPLGKQSRIAMLYEAISRKIAPSPLKYWQNLEDLAQRKLTIGERLKSLNFTRVDLIELDIIKFFKENGIPYPEHILHNHYEPRKLIYRASSPV